MGLPYLGCAAALVENAEAGDWDAIFALLLCQINSVEAITLLDHDNVEPGIESWFTQVFAMARLTQLGTVSSPLTLSKLKYVALYHVDGGYSDFNIGEVTTYLSLKSLENFHATDLAIGVIRIWICLPFVE